MHCQYPGCDDSTEAVKVFECELCSTHFCTDHGTIGGDDYPSRCWECGGFNVDE